MWVAAWLIAGGLLGAGFSHAAYTFKWGARTILGYGLIVASIIYLPIGVSHGRPLSWMALETLGVVVYVVIAFLGMSGSSWWLVAGWITHPFWAIVLHHFGLGAGFGPYWLTVSSAGFDVLVAVMI
ncbi:MAG: hypothetical protein ACREQD_08840, partial [Candidatus Binataceae bacterium]